MSLIRNFLLVGGGTGSSRILGFGRDMLMAAALGAGPVADAFFVAFRLPNLFRRIFAEGAFNSAFVPLFARELEGQGQEAARSFAQQALAALTLTLLVLTIVAELAMPLVMYVLAPGFASDPEKFDLAVQLTRICFPYLLFVSLVALFSGLLNALGRFAVAAFAPTLLNVVFIGALLLIVWSGHAETPTAGVWLSWAVFFGGIAQLLMLIFAARRAGMAPALVRPRLTPGVKRLVALAVPGVLAGGITQINIVIGTMIASMAPQAVSYLYYADRIYQLPLGLVGVAIGVVLLPELARRLRAGEDGAAMHQQNRALEFALALTVPAAVALAAVPGPIISGLFARGAFTEADAAATAGALAAFGLGLPAFVMIKVFQPGFFAREDTRTPMWFAGVNAAINIVLSLALFPFLAHVGIAIATSVGGWVNAALLAIVLRRRGGLAFDDRLGSRVARLVVASAVMGAALVGVRVLAEPALAGMAGDKAILLVLLVGTGLFVYGGLAVMLGVLDRREIMGAVRRGRPENLKAQ
ncbi:murein biosynthesis integral membrane protein MurJ [Lutibaculum baratangense]|uniref:Probable lipid II flippase MurJ n=1 Tax=Lutibaculum baratangense AMV1 TaxID=631454 RepID=V4RIH4_9HYPH|nr:murein biosynthesis integral membrane protein MurJ [Lutibaculum baratangense]ESR25886.1 putative peptidoglycan lipid II flippase MurJ [Lutibaculum baratangense AMV1]